MTVTSTDIANEAILLMGGNQDPVTGVAPLFDSSTNGKALRYLYAPCVAMVSRQFAWDFARNTVSLVASGNTPPQPWTYEYVYPANTVQVWQVMPATITDANNPLPTNWTVANNVVSGSQARVIQTDVASAKAVINNNPTEDTWDSDFRAAVVRLLASELAIATAGKPETSKLSLDTGMGFLEIAKTRDS